MVSKTSAISSNSSSASNSIPAPSLSYADRAKKAKKEKQPALSLNPVSSHAQRPGNPSATGTTSSTNASGSTASKDGSNPASTDVTPNSSVIMTRPESPLMNGIAKEVTTPIPPSPATPAVPVAPNPVTSTKPAPVPNVWSIRKEQMALKAAGHPPPIQTTPSSTLGPLPSSSQKPPQNRVISPIVSRNAASLSARTAAATTSLPNTNHRPPVLNGIAPPTNPPTTSTTENEDPFVVRILPHAQPPPPPSARSLVPSVSMPSGVTASTRTLPPSASVPLPPTKDAESWPEVGKPSATSHHGAQVVDQGLVEDGSGGSKDGSEKGQAQATGPSLKKGEKATWVQIPPEELQAVADAFRQANAQPKHHSRSRSQRNNHQGQQQNAAGGSRGRVTLPQSQSHSGIASHASSAPTSQSHSMAPSQSHSGIPSNAQSRAHSRMRSHAGSVHSSPRRAGKGRLPDEAGVGVVTGTSGYVYSPRRPPRVLSPQPTPQQPEVPVVSPVPVYGDFYVSPPLGPPHIPVHPPLSQGHSPQQQSGYRSPYHPAGVSDFVGPTYPVGRQSPVPLPQGFPYQGYPHQPYGFEYGQPQLQGQQYINWNGQVDRQQDYAPPPHLPSPQVHSPNIKSQHPLPQPLPQVSSSDIGQQGHERNVDRVVTMFGSIGANGEIDASPKGEGVKEKQFVFGSIGAGLDQATLSPAVAPIADTVEPKAFTAFSIGVAPGEPGPSRLRSRTRSTKARSRAQGVNGGESHALKQTADTELEVKVIDLTGTEPKWEFASTEPLETGTGTLSDDGVMEEPPVQQNIPVIQQAESYSPPAPEQPFAPLPAPNGLPMHMPTPTPISLPPPAPYALQSAHSGQPLQPMVGSDEFLEVQDFGFGFGPVSGTGYGPIMARELRDRDRERDRFEWAGRGGADWARGRDWRERDGRGDPQRDFRERETQREFRVEREFVPNIQGRPRRGSAAFVPGNGGFVAERGGFGGRRGRAFGGRGSRGFGRGNFSHHHPQQQPQQPPPRQPPFVVTPPTNFQSLQSQSPVEPASGYFPAQTTYYPNPGFDVYQPPVPGPAPAPPPVPAPLSAVPFPLDPTRWQLLGQLEYYLSPQNMVSDFFLRQRMDNRGWVPISLIANFNRVKQLTMDERLVREVLILSTVVEVQGEWVRMNRWEQFVLPNARRSTVEDNMPGSSGQVDGYRERQVTEGYVLVGEDEDDEDEVEFVMG